MAAHPLHFAELTAAASIPHFIRLVKIHRWQSATTTV
jgi:hypothetical protein